MQVAHAPVGDVRVNVQDAAANRQHYVDQLLSLVPPEGELFDFQLLFDVQSGVNAFLNEREPGDTLQLPNFQRLGSGSSGSVVAINDKAVKILEIDLNKEDRVDYQVKSLSRECSMFGRALHEGVVPLITWKLHWETSSIVKALLVFELAAGGSVADILPKDGLSYGIVLACLLQILCALRFLHHHVGVVHMDIKPANILMDGCGVYKIGDFGCCLPEGAIVETVLGTPAFIAPGQARQGPGFLGNRAARTEWDLWALAIMVITMLTGQTPMQKTNPNANGLTILFLVANLKEAPKCPSRNAAQRIPAAGVAAGDGEEELTPADLIEKFCNRVLVLDEFGRPEAAADAAAAAP